MGKYFGTDGFRGEAGIDLTADHAYKVGRFLGWYYNALRERNGNNEPARIVIGKDTRRSSYMFEYSLVAGLTASGADAYLLHVTTTPSVAYIARVDDFDCGIMISASHNPYYDNGIKLIDCYGEKMLLKKNPVQLHKSARVCHLHGENLPQYRRLSATSSAPFHQKALPAIPPTELGDTNLLLRVLEYCTAVTFFPKAQCAATACGFQHPSRGTFR